MICEFQECCLACRDGLSSQTCSAPWFEDEPILNRTFQTCCREPKIVSISMEAPSSGMFSDKPVALDLRSSNAESSLLARITWPRGISRSTGPLYPITCNNGYHYNRTLSMCEGKSQSSSLNGIFCWLFLLLEHKRL